MTSLSSHADDESQEVATLSRLIYGLSSAYHMTGNQRYLDAARSGVEVRRLGLESLYMEVVQSSLFAEKDTFR